VQKGAKVSMVRKGFKRLRLCRVVHNPKFSARPRLGLIGMMSLLVLVGFAVSSLSPAQEHITPTSTPASSPRDRSTAKPEEETLDYNLELVAASPDQIKEVLEKDPGLFVELKRLMAKQATERGQIVSEDDLKDDVVLTRLETDTRFRSLATRMLQRYGYLTPQVNPTSEVGREQDLVLRDRAIQLANAESRLTGPASRTQMTAIEPGCSPSMNPLNCPPVNGRAVTQQTPPGWQAPQGWQMYQAPCDPTLAGTASCPQPTNEQLPYPNSIPPGTVPPGTVVPPPDMQRPDMLSSSLMTASAVSSTNMSRSNGQQQQGAMGADQRQTELLDVSGGIPPILPENPLQRQTLSPTTEANLTSPTMSSRTGLLREPGEAPEPVEMVSSASPYAFLPSLYDLYMQAAPRNGRLQRFGLDVFRRNLTNTNIPMDVPAGPDYVLGPGDAVTIDLWGGVSGRIFRSVDREGRLSLPEVGPLEVSGKTLGDVQQVVQRALRTQYRDVSADLSLARLRTVRIYVVGEVASPGAYDISSLSTPLNALFAAGGITSRGSLRELKHFRGQQMIEEVDAYDLLLHGVRGDMKNLENGDTLLVPPVGPQVSVDGMVRRPAIYELRGETNLAQALDLAGGILPAAALRQIEVQRLVAHEKRSMLSVNIDEASDPQAVQRQLSSFQVNDGDEIHIFPIASYNASAVYLQGHVLRPGRYAYSPGMRLTDLVGSYKDLLPEPAEHYAEIISLQEPDWRPVVKSVDLAAALANPQSSPKLAPLDTVRIFGRYDLEAAPTVWVSGNVREPGQYRTTGQMHLRDAIYQAGGLLPDAAIDSAQLFRTQPDGSLRILNVNLTAALDADPMENIALQSRDRILVHRSVFREDPPTVYIQGEVLNPGRYPLGTNMRLTDLLFAAGGPKRSADLTDGDLTSYYPVTGGNPRGEHQRIDIAAVFHDSNLNFTLKDGDVLTVPQLPGWKDLGASIAVKGEVKNPGVYGIQPGERLSSVLKRAGGLLPTAFPQGAIFTRPSVRELQEKSRQDLIHQIEQQGATVRTSLSTSGAEQAQLAAEATQQQQRVLETLRKAQVSGRMVIRLRPGLKDLEGSSQDIEVRDGDSIEIPKTPGIVLVVGQVYNSNAITYVTGRNAAWYLSQSGGATKLADRHAIFVVHANGEITSREQGGWWSHDVLSSPIRPGDTIVVPERVLLGDTRWKNIIALAQIAEAGAITAAVVF
jgi:polysaccharide biosynthesis/export protein